MDSMIEYQELYELHIDVIFNKIKTKINQNANETAIEQILVNRNDGKSNRTTEWSATTRRWWRLI